MYIHNMQTEMLKRLFIYAAIVGAIILMLSGCSAKWHLKQAKKKGLVLDTITVTDTLIIPDMEKSETIRVKYDTIQSIRYQDCTRVELRWVPRYINDTISIIDSVEVKVDCPDSKEIKTNTTVNREVPKTRWERFKNKFVFVVPFVILLLVGLLTLLKR